jgi:hypothetical protein
MLEVIQNPNYLGGILIFVFLSIFGLWALSHKTGKKEIEEVKPLSIEDIGDLFLEFESLKSYGKKNEALTRMRKLVPVIVNNDQMMKEFVRLMDKFYGDEKNNTLAEQIDMLSEKDRSMVVGMVTRLSISN